MELIMTQETPMNLSYYSKANETERVAMRKWMSSMLKMGPMKVAFLKKDGSERVMNCTLQEGIAIPHEKTTDRVKQTSDEVCPVWDIDKGAWRSFRYDSITRIDIDITK